MFGLGKNLLTEGIEDTVHIQKSPFFEGFQRGLQAALIGAPTGAVVQAIRGKNPMLGAIMGAAVAGIPTGLAAAGAQKLDNLDQEAILRYHASRIKEREPLFFMPPPQHLGRVFSRVHQEG